MTKHLPLLLFLSAVFTACADKGSDPYREHGYEIPADLHFEADLQPYFDSYVADAAKAGVPVPDETLEEFRGLMWTDRINLKNSPDASVLGHCQRHNVDAVDVSQRLRFVELLRPNAERKVGSTLVDETTLKVMVYHELGHCLHDFTGHTNGKSAAIMNAYMQPARYFDLDGLVQDHFLMLKRMHDDPSFRP